MAPHTGSATPEQIDALLNFLSEHKDLARGKLRSIEGRVQAKRLWQEICNMLNAMGGCTKTIDQWQKVWSDRKHLAKKAAADARKSASATGGGPSTAPDLSEMELKVLSIMGDNFGGRQTGARVPAFFETNDEPIMPSTSSQTTRPIIPPQPRTPPSPLLVVEDLQFSPILAQPTRQLPVLRDSSTSRRSQTNRTRRSASATDVRGRLFEIEEERAGREERHHTELAGIRSELTSIRVILLELCGLVRDYLHNVH